MEKTVEKWICLLVLGMLWLGFGADLKAQDAGGSLPITAEFFPDAVFRSCIKEWFDNDNNDILSEAELQEVTSIGLPNDVADATGIKLFPYLSDVVVVSNPLLKTLDVSGCTALTSVYCRWDSLTTLDVSGCTALTSLSCGEGRLTTLKMDGCHALAYLNCYYNALDSLDVSGFSELKELSCRSNPLTYLNISNFAYCDTLDWWAETLSGLNQLQTLVARNCIALKVIDLRGFRTLKLLDVSGCTSLTHLKNSGANVLDASGCTSLTYLRCGSLRSLDVSDCLALDTLTCSGGLTSLDVSQNAALAYLDCGSNQLKDLDVSRNVALTYLSCASNQLTSLDVSQNTGLEYLNCASNQLTSLDVSQNTGLEYLNCASNQLTSLDVSQNTGLEYLNCVSNQLTSLDVSQNTGLEYLICGSNQLTSLDLSKNAALRELGTNDNRRKVLLDEKGRLDLSTLTGFDVKKAQDCGWHGGILSGNMLEFQQGGVSCACPTHCANSSCAFAYFALIDSSPVAMPVISFSRENGGCEVYLRTETKDATIYYTTDESIPTEFSQQYQGSFYESGVVTIKAISVKNGVKSRIATATCVPLSNGTALSATTLRVYAQDRTIYLSEPAGEVEVFTTSGRRVYRGVSTAIPVPRSGVYIITAASQKYKVGVM